MEEFRLCSECGQPFLVVDDTDSLCDNCAGKLLTGVPFCRSEKNVWDDKEIRKQWQKSAKENTKKLSDKYAIKQEVKVIKYSDNDTLLNRVFVIK